MPNQKGRTTGRHPTTQTTTTRGRRGRSKSGTHHKSTSGNGRHNGPHMVETLEEGFLGEVADVLNAERQIGKAMPKLAQAVELPRLRDALEQHAEETSEQIRRLEHIFELIGHRPEAERCEGMQGILTEAGEILHKAGPGPLRDAMIIGAAQKVEHYEIAAYGTLCAWADEIGDGRLVRILEDTLYEEKAADRKLTRIAESLANREASRRRENFGRRGEEFEREERGSWRNQHQGQQWQGRGSEGWESQGGRGRDRQREKRFEGSR